MLILFLFILGCTGISEAKPARPESLPKIVWTYEETAPDANFIHLLCLNRMRNILEDSRWVLEVITPSNIFIYLHQHEEYKLMIKNHRKYLTFLEEIEIVKLMILQEYGGIWIDPNYILLESVEWIHHLPSEKPLSTFGNTAYEAVFFSTDHLIQLNQNKPLLSAKEQPQAPALSINLAIILALKQSPIIRRWLADLSKTLQQNIEVDPSDEANKIARISTQTIRSILEQGGGYQAKFKEYSIWKFTLPDNFDILKASASTENMYALSDFYTKFPYLSIAHQLQNSKHFVSLTHVQQQLNEILNPNISKLSYLGKSVYSKLLCPQQIKCAHYVDPRSLVYEFLLKDTHFEPEMQDLIDSDNRMLHQCTTLSNLQWKLQAQTIAVSLLAAFFIYFTVKIQKLCLQLLYIKAKVFLRPRITLMISILKTVKSVIQYSSGSEI